jgi:NUMOD3 motif
MEKYGFVYIWYDKKRKMYYIGCRWGYENDGYICSSNRMRDAYRRRPNDFKRRILISNIKDRKQTLIEEYNFLSFIKKEELGKKYYNLSNHHFGHWTTNNEKILTVGEKISLSHRNNPDWGNWSKGRLHSDEAKEKLREANRKQFEDQEQREMRRQKSLELWSNPEYLEKQRLARSKKGFYKGFNKKHTEESKQKMREKSLGKKHTQEAKEKLSKLSKNTIWINNGEYNKRINKYEKLPEGFTKGIIKNGQQQDSN